MVTFRRNIGAMCQHRTGRREWLSSRTLARRRWLTECGAYLRSSAPPACGHVPAQHRGDVPAPQRRERLSSRTLARRRWLTECGAYLRSSAPPACGHVPAQHRGDVPAPHRTAGMAQQQNAGAAAVAD
ncbi:hypothetical protein RQL84_26910 [Citrobacter freundii]|nr:hypothetical protein [Citrobacter freundii]